MNQQLNLKSITIKYLETGHTQMEADSIHSTIEKAKRGAPVYSPDEWVTIIAIARRKNPYQVDKMIFSDILDLKAMHKGLVHNLKKNQDGDAVRWMKVKALRVIKSQPHLLYYKERLGGVTNIT